MISAHDDDTDPSYAYSSPSCDTTGAGSDFSEPIGGKYFNGHCWTCEKCDEEFLEEELKDGKCPCGHIVCFCDTLAFDSDEDVCYCGPSPDDDESAEDAPEMAWGEQDGVWRCTGCLWEVEANDENEGYCHCPAKPETDWSKSTRCIELLHYDDYKPADSDSSGEESVDSEPDSDEEAFIDDDALFNPEDSTPTTAVGLGESQANTVSADDHVEAVDDEPDGMDLLVDGWMRAFTRTARS